MNPFGQLKQYGLMVNHQYRFSLASRPILNPDYLTEKMTTEDFTIEFEKISAPLKSYILRLTASIHDTEDIVQETWIKASSNLSSFRGEASLKTWIFSIASNLSIDHLRKKKRWPENVTDICKEAAQKNPTHFKEAMKIIETSEYAKFEIKEHIAFCFLCIAKSLPLEQHLCLLLKEVYDFKIKEVAKILQTTEALIKYHLHTARQKMIEIFEGRCALINQKGICHQCTEINGIFNPKQNMQEELMKIKMVKEVAAVDKERLFNLRMEVLKGIDPYKSGAHDLQLHHLEHNRKVMENYLKEKS
jgi:RNA polymerase sigma-70 factor (ECF subfamily)